MGKLTHLTASQFVPAPPEAVWDTVARGFGDVAAYNPAIERSEWDGDVREGVGATRVCHVAPTGMLKETITDWTDGESFALELVDSSLPMDTVQSRFLFAPEADGTRMTQEFGYRMKGLLGPFSGLMKGSMQKTLDDGLAGLARHHAT